MCDEYNNYNEVINDEKKYILRQSSMAHVFSRGNV